MTQEPHGSWLGYLAALAPPTTLASWPHLPPIEVLKPVADGLLFYVLPGALAVANIWLVVRKTRRELADERAALAKARLYEEALGPDRRSLWQRLRGRPLITGPAPLDGESDSMATTDPQAHHIGKDTRA